MKIVLDVQWACIRIASMAGAAGDPDFDCDFDDDEQMRYAEYLMGDNEVEDETLA